MGFLSKVFGGGGSDKSSTTTTVTIPTWMEPSVKQMYGDSADLARRIKDQPYTAYKGNRVAGIQVPERLMINRIMQNPNTNASLNKAKSYSSDVLAGKYLKGNPYLDGMIRKVNRSVTDNYNKTMLPQMQANLHRQGAFGGSGWAQSNRDMQSELAQSLADANTAMRFDNYAQERGYQDQAAGDMANYSNMDLQNMQAALSAGELDRGVQQGVIDAAYGDFIENRDWLFRALQGVQAGLGNSQPFLGSSGTSKGGSKGSTAGGVMQMIGALGSMK